MKAQEMVLSLALGNGSLRVVQIDGKWVIDYQASSPAGQSGWLVTARGKRKDFAKVETALKEAQQLLIEAQRPQRLEVMWR